MAVTEDRDDVPGRVDPRFVLANERTFLAWSRTALALVAAGLAVTQLLHEVAVPWGRRLLGVPLILTGGAIGYLSHRRRIAVDRALANHEDVPRTFLPGLLAAVVVGGAAVAVLLALSTPRT